MPQNEDELELREGDAVQVMERCDDGWFVGTSVRTKEFGTFPGNYVQSVWQVMSSTGRVICGVWAINPKFTIAIFIHYKPRIAVAIPDLQWMKMSQSGWKI